MDNRSTAKFQEYLQKTIDSNKRILSRIEANDDLSDNDLTCKEIALNVIHTLEETLKKFNELKD
jgi:hypothetical protein